MRKILISLSVIGAVAAVVVGGTTSFFSDSETSVGNTFAAGEIDLGIDNTSYYNGAVSASTSWQLDYNISDSSDTEKPRLFFNFNDLKPGDDGEDTISVHVKDNDAWACMEINLTAKDDNGLTEPEAGDGDATGGNGQGELQNAINFVWWADDGDNVLESNETAHIFDESTLGELDGMKVNLADSTGNGILSAGPLSPTQTYYIGKAWCFGDLSLTPVPAGQGVDPTVASGISCNGKNLNNITQTDSVKGNVTFTAVQSRNNQDFTCEPPPEIACTEEQAWADTVQGFHQGVQKDGNPIAPDRSDPNDAVGESQSTGAFYDNPTLLGTFFSLGFNQDVALGFGGSISLGFNEFILNGAGADLKVFEVTGGDNYPDEKVKIEASQDGISWTLLGDNLVRDSEVDLGPLPWAKFVRVTDRSVRASFSDAIADGYDVDGVKALNCVQALGTPIPTPTLTPLPTSTSPAASP